MAVYLDASAAVKLVVREVESAALRRWLRSHPQRVASALLRTEVMRTVRRAEPGQLERARAALRGIAMQVIDDDILDVAARIEPVSVRSLDAIHLATAVRLGSDLEALVTYDARMIDGAQALGLKVASPS